MNKMEVIGEILVELTGLVNATDAAYNAEKDEKVRAYLTGKMAAYSDIINVLKIINEVK